MTASATRAAWTIVGLLWAVALINYLDRQLVVTMPGPIKAELHIGDEKFGLLSSVFLWIYGIFSPIAGYLADRFGKRRVILASLAVWSIATFASGMATSFGEMLAARAMLGISEAFYMPAAVALIIDYHRQSTRSRATGLHLSGVYAGSVLGGLGGALAEAFGWRPVFLAIGGLGVAYAIVLSIVFPSPPAMPPEQGSEDPAPTRLRGAIGTLLSTPGFLLLLTMNLLNGAAYWPVRNWLAEFFRGELGVTPAWAGVFGPMAFNGAAFVGMLIASNVSDWWVARCARARTLVPAIGFFVAAPCPLGDGGDRRCPGGARLRARRRHVSRLSRRQSDARDVHRCRRPDARNGLWSSQLGWNDGRWRHDVCRRAIEGAGCAIRRRVPGRRLDDPDCRIAPPAGASEADNASAFRGGRSGQPGPSSRRILTIETRCHRKERTSKSGRSRRGRRREGGAGNPLKHRVSLRGSCVPYEQRFALMVSGNPLILTYSVYLVLTCKTLPSSCYLRS